MAHISAALSVSEAKQRFDRALCADKQQSWPLLFSVTLIGGGQKIGIASVDKLDPVRASADIGRILLPEWHGLGFGTELSMLLISSLEAELGMTTFTKHIRNRNISAIESAKKLGFKLVKTAVISSQPDIDLYQYASNQGFAFE